MKPYTLCWSAAILLLGPLVARGEIHQPHLLAPTLETEDSYYSQGSSIPGEYEPESLPEGEDRSSGYDDAADSPYCGCAADVGCGDCCGYGDGGCGLFGPCCLGEPYKLRDCLVGECCWLDVGGWSQIGYHSDNERFSNTFGDLRSFNDVPDGLRLHQQWLYFEKLAEATECQGDWGFRFDIMYGTDAQKTQSFGNDDAKWDNADSFDHGIYGWAMPQAYLQLAYGDWEVKIGHFFTPVGYEVVMAPGNFFYSHSYTQYNSEPFTHTGVLSTYNGIDNMTLYAGWTLGWDTGFDQAFGGSNWLGGFAAQLTDDIKFTYISTAGDFGRRSAGTTGYGQSLVLDVALSEDLKYVFQSDYVHHDGSFDDPNEPLEDKGVNQYLFYTINDCWALGTRMEWWKGTGFTGNAQSYYEVTYGLNYKPHANVIVRPEVRHNWTPGEEAYANAQDGVDFNQTVFGIDAILSF
ncbi:MAG: outer membrane beta-barrel protein [Pirellulales bacterium]